MLTSNQILLINELRKNARVKYSHVSRKYSVPISTLFDSYASLEKRKFISRQVSVVDFRKVGFFLRSILICSHINSDTISFAKRNSAVNNACICAGDIIMLDCIFKSLKEMWDFIEYLKSISHAKISWFEVSECILIENKLI